MGSLEVGKSGRLGGHLQLHPSRSPVGHRASRGRPDQRVPMTQQTYNLFADWRFWALFTTAAIAHAAGLW